jgi:uncharacterized protein (TIGR03792 family)
MIVEMLRITCPPEKQAAFLRRDAEVGIRGPMEQPFYLGKEMWSSPDRPGEVVLVIHMTSFAELRALPQAWVDGIEAAMGDLKMPEISTISEVTHPDPRYRLSGVDLQAPPPCGPPMAVEFLRVTCPPGKRDAFIRQDHEVWTRGLETQSGFLGKEAWCCPELPGEVLLVNHWESRAHLDAISSEWRARQEAAMGDLFMPTTSEIFHVTRPDPRYRRSGA